MSMVQDDYPALRSRKKQGGSVELISELSGMSPKPFSDRSKKNGQRPSIKTSNLP